MGYGSQAIKLLQSYFNGEFSAFKEAPMETEKPAETEVNFNFEKFYFFDRK